MNKHKRQELLACLAAIKSYIEGSDTTAPDATPAWYRWALSKVGTKEVPGSKSNAEILGWMKDAFTWASDDSTLAWCGIFVKEALEEAGYEYVKGFASARAWLNYGEPVELLTEKPGDICVFWRGSKDGWKGHVGFFVRRDGDQIAVLGGNQSNSVSIANQPAFKLLGVRRPDTNA